MTAQVPARARFALRKPSSPLLAAGLALATLLSAASPGSARNRDAARAACGADYQRLCKGIVPGGGRLKECFQTHAADLSQGCRDFLKSQRAAAK